MKRLIALLIVSAFFLPSCNCAKKSDKSEDEEIGYAISEVDRIIDYTIERSINLDYRAWAMLELTDDQNPKARLTFFGSLEPYFTDGFQVTGKGIKSVLSEKELILFDINFEGATLPDSGCNENLNYRLTLLEGGTIDMTRGALVVFCSKPKPKNKMYVYRAFLKEQ